MNDTRVIILHKHPVSAKVRILRLAHGGICGFEALPELASVLDDEVVEKEGNVISHPAVMARQAEKELALEEGMLDIINKFKQRVDVPQGVINVYLLGLVGHDTPDEGLAEQGASLQLITEMRDLPPAEIELLRRAYVAVMEG